MIRMYATAKGKFARRELDWRALPSTAYLVDGSYVPNIETDTTFPNSDLAGSVLGAVGLTNQTVVTSWCAADPMVFVGLTLARPCGQAVISTDFEKLPLLLLEFPTILPNAAADNFSLLVAQRGPGWFRL